MNALYSKTILNCYKSLRAIVKQIDELIYDKALNSHCAGKSVVYESTIVQVERVIKLIDKKNDLINLKMITDTALGNIAPSSAQLLSLRFFDCLKSDEVIAKLQLSARTYYRQLARGIEQFASSLARIGYGDKWFEANYLTQQWIKSLCANIAKEDNKTSKN